LYFFFTTKKGCKFVFRRERGKEAGCPASAGQRDFCARYFWPNKKQKIRGTPTCPRFPFRPPAISTGDHFPPRTGRWAHGALPTPKRKNGAPKHPTKPLEGRKAIISGPSRNFPTRLFAAPQHRGYPRSGPPAQNFQIFYGHLTRISVGARRRDCGSVKQQTRSDQAGGGSFWGGGGGGFPPPKKKKNKKQGPPPPPTGGGATTRIFFFYHNTHTPPPPPPPNKPHSKSA